VTALFLKLEKHFREPLKRDFIPALLFESLTDLVVLTIDTPEIAQSQKDIARAVCPNQRGLFAKVWCVRGHDRQQPRVARGYIIVKSIDVAVSRTYAANAEHLH
jgi:hypothetical protein